LAPKYLHTSGCKKHVFDYALTLISVGCFKKFINQIIKNATCSCINDLVSASSSDVRPGSNLSRFLAKAAPATF